MRRPRAPDAGLVISAGKMSNLWSGQPVTIRLDDLDVIRMVLGCEPNDLLVPGPEKARALRPSSVAAPAAVAGDRPRIERRSGRTEPPL
ncbi:helix-turn-helix transcriptional regulator [Streptomyces sp. NPDC005859]|uniref:helix-turn-helix domain-containing protein n=1 Tax=Streptomyces sp. NPDC005859 TaxID=3157170 RepID=UPI0033D57C7B